MSCIYNVLWIDDEHESMKALHKTAIDSNLKLFPFKSMNGGCTEFENNTAKYDAILFDAKFFENESDQPGTEDTKWVHKAKDRLRDIDKSIAFFVLTGQDEAYNSREFKNAFPHVFSKGVERDEDEIFKMLVDACTNRELTKLKHKHPNPFALCSHDYIGTKHFDRLLGLVKDIENPSEIKVAPDMLSSCRKILEAIFAKLTNIGLVPEEISNGFGAINGTSIFLSGKNKEYTYCELPIHPMIAENIYRIINITQDVSHNEGNKLGADDYLSKSHNHYLYLSSIYLLLDIMDEVKTLIDENVDIEMNLAKWEKTPTSTVGSTEGWISGNITRVAENGWGTFIQEGTDIKLGVPSSMMRNNNLELHDNVKVETEPSPDGTKTFIKQIKIID